MQSHATPYYGKLTTADRLLERLFQYCDSNPKPTLHNHRTNSMTSLLWLPSPHHLLLLHGCYGRPVQQCWTTALGNSVRQHCWATALDNSLVGQQRWTTALDNSVGQRRWTTALDNGVGQQRWTTALDNSVGQRRWTTALDNGVGQQCWATVLGNSVRQALTLLLAKPRQGQNAYQVNLPPFRTHFALHVTLQIFQYSRSTMDFFLIMKLSRRIVSC